MRLLNMLYLSALLLLRALRVLLSCRLIGASSSVLGITTSVLALVMTRNYNMFYIECLYIRILERARVGALVFRSPIFCKYKTCFSLSASSQISFPQTWTNVVILLKMIPASQRYQSMATEFDIEYWQNPYFRILNQNGDLWPTLKRIGSPGLLPPSSPARSWCCFLARFWIIFCKQFFPF